MFGNSTCYDFMNSVRRPFNPKAPVVLILTWIIQPAMLVTFTLMMTRKRCFLIQRNNESKGTVDDQGFLRPSDKPSLMEPLSEDSGLEKVETPFLILKNLSHKDKPVSIRSFRKNLWKTLPTVNLREMYIHVRVNRLSLFKRTAFIIVNVCSTCCWAVSITSFT